MEFRERDPQFDTQAQYEFAGAAAQETVIDNNGLAVYTAQVFGWMFAALLVTAGVSLGVLSSEELFNTVRGFVWPLIAVKFFLVFMFAASVHRMSAPIAGICFFSYSVATGLWLSIILAMYTASSAANVFMITAGTFGIMAVYGFTTKKNLTSMGSLLFTALIGIILATVLNIFIFQSPMMELIVSCLAVFIFTGLIAYDTQMIRETYMNGMETTSEGQKYAMYAAFSLYLDFVGLFVHLLQLMGDRE